MLSVRLVATVFAFVASFSASVEPQQKKTESAARPVVYVDPLLKEPYVDIDEWRDKPVRHRYVHGGFKGTDARFSIYFPPKEQYQRRFFQYVTPIPINENEGASGSGTGDQVGFAFATGAYYLVTNEGGMAAMAREPTLGAYRVNAASAEYSRVLAAQMYGPHRPYGYAYGGSGGAFRTIGGFENAPGVWDGAVPYVVGSPEAIPNVFTTRLLALRVLKNKFPTIVDAMEPGGSGNPYAGLTEEQRQVLAEVTRMGFPLQSWFDYESIGMGAFPILFGMVVHKDPTYFSEDFWNVPGYAGANPTDSLLHAHVQHRTTIKRVISTEELAKGGQQNQKQGQGGVDMAWQQLRGAPAAFEVDSVPTGDLGLANVMVKTGAASGTSFALGKVEGNTIFVGLDMGALMSGRGPNTSALKQIKPGDQVQIDNSDFLAAHYYHRYQVPTPDFYVWNQFRTPNEIPIYPQRPKLIGPEFAASAGGTTQSGRFQGKMILLESLWDQDAFPWQADWYASKVKAVLGSRFDQNFRAWFTDRALHGDIEDQPDPTHTVSYVGVLQQALRDLSAWVEKGIAPPASTTYRVVDGQVEVPSIAAERRGIQPIVHLTANGGARAEVATGQLVTLSAVIEVPRNTGRVIAAEWNFEGGREFTTSGQLTKGEESGARATLNTTHAFPKPGTYFPTVRVESQRQGDAKTPYARIENLARVRVVVK